jgi:hypothetical protein
VNGRLRARIETVPDVPLTEATLHMQGGDKGLIVNSANLCASANKATAEFEGQNAKKATLHPTLQVSCKGKEKRRTARP